MSQLTPNQAPLNNDQKNVQAKPKAGITLLEYLNSAGVTYEVVPHALTHTLQETADLLGIDSKGLVRTVLLQDDNGMLMAILPSNYLIDFKQLCSEFEREFAPVSASTVSNLFRGCEKGSYPPLPELYGMDAIVDKQLLENETVYFEAGSHEALIKLERSQFEKIVANSWMGHFTEPPSRLYIQDRDDTEVFNQAIHEFLPKRMKERVEETFELPAIPPIAHKILQLRSDPNADASHLAALVEKDPSLSAQVVSWASSPYYAYAGKLQSVEEAIINVLGFDLVLNLALGIAIGREMRVPHDGPLGLKAFWKHALFTAEVVEAFVKAMPRQERPKAGLAYLSGLIHNFGHLLLGQIFPPQFYLLNKFVAINPHIPITMIENYSIGIGHDLIGSWLMRSWNMPDEIVTAIRWHHNPYYRQNHSKYALLVNLAITYLKREKIGDGDSAEISEETLERLSLTRKEADEAFQSVWENREHLEGLLKLLFG